MAMVIPYPWVFLAMVTPTPWAFPPTAVIYCSVEGKMPFSNMHCIVPWQLCLLHKSLPGICQPHSWHLSAEAGTSLDLHISCCTKAKPCRSLLALWWSQPWNPLFSLGTVQLSVITQPLEISPPQGQTQRFFNWDKALTHYELVLFTGISPHIGLVSWALVRCIYLSRHAILYWFFPAVYNFFLSSAVKGQGWSPPSEEAEGRNPMQEAQRTDRTQPAAQNTRKKGMDKPFWRKRSFSHLRS